MVQRHGGPTDGDEEKRGGVKRGLEKVMKNCELIIGIRNCRINSVRGLGFGVWGLGFGVWGI
jgi:hypothetical protein